MPVLSKVCPQCSSMEHCRRLACVKCGYVFAKSGGISKKKRVASARACETEQETCVRRAKNRQNMASARACETEQETCVRRTRNRQNMASARACETEQETCVRRAKNRQSMASARACETEQETCARRTMVKQSMARKRVRETEEETCERRAKNRRVMAYTRAESKTIDVVIEQFQTKVKLGPEYVCTCCHRMMYKQNVVLFKPTNYTKANTELLSKVCEHSYVSFDGKEWLCKTCDGTLSRGLMPVQCKANGMELDNVPPELSCLNPLERRLISLRVPFMKMVALPSGKQRCIHGPAVNVPSKVDKVCTMLPRLPSQCELVPLKLKRKLSYKGYYMYDYVSPERLTNALKWLKAKNPLYANINIDNDWLDNAIAEDEELTTSLLEQPESMDDSSIDVCPNEPEPMECTNGDQPACTNGNTSNPVTFYVNMLESFARQHGFSVHNVPGDGDCLYSAVAYQLQNVGHDVNKSDLRQMVATYLSDHGDECSPFVHQPVASNDGYNADNEPLDAEDVCIESVTDPIVQQELRWQKYLKRLKQGAWGDNIAIAAMCNMFDMDINVFWAHQAGTSIAKNTPNVGTGKYELNIGLIMQYHFVGLDKVENADHITDNAPNNVQPSVSEPDNATNGVNEELDDETIAEGDEHRLKITGGTHASMLTVENPEQIVNIAPAEGQKPLFIMCDPQFELMCNPDKFCFGKGGFGKQRDRKLTYRKYFNARLLDIDGRFARDLDYLFVAQYIVESKQVLDDGNNFAWRQKPSRRFTASQVQDRAFLSEHVRNDRAYRFLKNVRGSPPYYQRTFYELLAMIRQLGTPTWFFTLSAADMKWPDMIQIIARQYGENYSDEDVQALSYDEKCSWLRHNPVTAARHFQYRLSIFFQDVLKSKAKPLGEIVEYGIRVEFQARGSPHAHCVLWVKEAPKYGVATNNEVCAFIDQYITCAIPTEECKLKELVLLLQQHKHSSYCKRNKQCRFNFPHPPSPKTIIAEPCPDSETLADAQKLLLEVRKALLDCDDNATIDDVLSKANVELDKYIEALEVTSSGAVVLLKREPNEQNINNYNASVMLAWQANMDVQYVLNAYACVMYVASYIMKTDRAMGMLLKQVAAEVRTDELKTQLHKIGSAFLNHREVSAQECVYRILSMPMKQLSRSVVFVDTNAKKDRIAVLKSTDTLKQLDDEDTNVFQKSLIDRYQHRPEQIRSMCLAEFASTYCTSYNTKDDDSDTDALPGNESQLSATKITLTGGYGQMYERRKPAVIRFRKYNKDADASNWYRAKLMLYYPWYDESNDLLGGYTTYAEHYDHIKAIVCQNEQKYTLEEVENVQIDEDSRPEHAWCQLAPSTEYSNSNALEQGIETLTNLSEQDLLDNANLLNSNTSGLSVRFESAANPQVIAPDEYRELMRGLNSKQRAMVMYHRNWCKQAVKALKSSKPIEPYRVFLSGPGGVGKSHVIKLIQSDTLRLIRQSGAVELDDVLVLLTAPTGVAAFNVNGMTLHSAFLLGRGKYGRFQPLSHDRVNTLRSKLSKLVLLIIDEVSMVGADMLLEIHKRLQQINSVLPDVMFGGVSVLAVGDLYQLPPVGQPMLFSTVSDSYSQLYRSGSLWQDEFEMLELDEIMRQRDDSTFAELLCRVRTASCTDADIAVLKSRVTSPDSPDYPTEALHVYRLNADVDERNEYMLSKLASRSRTYEIKAKDAVTGQTKHIDLASLSSKRTETGGLHSVLKLACGARVMLTTNVDVSDGLVNGARGEITHIVTNSNNDVTTVLVKFDNEQVGIKACQSSQYRSSYPNAVPLSKIEVVFLAKGKCGAEITRLQFPLTLAWATTIHKVQGLTLDIVVDMKGSRFNPGQIYVAFSRVKALTGLHIVNFNAKAIKKSSLVDDEMTRLREKLLMTVPQLQCLPQSSHVTLALLNARSIVAKLADIEADFELNSANVLCFCETWLSSAQPSPVINASHVVLRCDRAMNDHKGGTMLSVPYSMQPSNTANFVCNGIESLVTTLNINGKRLQVAVVYRSPSVTMQQFVQLMTRLLDYVSITGIATLVVGDVNDDILCNSGSQVERFMSSHGYTQLVKHAITDRATLIDHVYFSKQCDNVLVQVRDVYYSDHDAVYCSVPVCLL